MPTATKPCAETTLAAAAKNGVPPVYHHLYALLHTLRALGSHQDQICTLLAEMQRTGKAGAGVRRDLKALLSDLPMESLETELHAVWSALDVT